MRAQVLSDPVFVKPAERFVRREINLEDPKNADFLARYPTASVPTFYVIDGESGKPALKWIGIATAAQMAQLLEDGERAIRAGSADAADAALARADRLYAEGKVAESAVAYREALRAAAPGWSRRDRVVESLVFALQESHQDAACAETALSELSRMDHGASFANAAGGALQCALDSGKGQDAIEPMVEEALTIASVGADRRSELFQVLVAARKKRGDSDGAHDKAAEWLEWLEKQAAAAPDPERRAVFDSHRLTAALELGEPERVLPALEASERDLPNDFNPPARLAVVYLALHRPDEAIVESRRALAKGMDGPRRLRVLDTLSRAQEMKGDRAAARATVEDALKFAESLPAPQRPDGQIAGLRQRLLQLR